MRKSVTVTLVLTLALAVMFGTTFVPISFAQGADSTKAPGSVPDTMKKVVPPPTPAVTPAAADTSKPKTTPPVDTTKKVMPPMDTTKKVVTPPDTTKKPVPPADTSKKVITPKTKTTAPGDTTKATKPKEGGKTVSEAVDPKAPYKSVTFAKGEKPKVVMETTMGKIVIELWPDVAMKHCQSFVYLVNKGFYDSTASTFHRIVPGFVIQGGDPNGNGTGGPGYTVPAEFSNKPHEDGTLSMARSQDVNSAGSQFFICLGRLTSLDGKYTVFGKVVEGLDVVHKIEKVKVAGERPIEPVKMTKVYVEKAN